MTVQDAIKESTKRKERLANALKTRPPVPNYAKEDLDGPAFVDELEHIDVHLRKEGLSVAMIFREFVKQRHGIDVPNFEG